MTIFDLFPSIPSKSRRCTPSRFGLRKPDQPSGRSALSGVYSYGARGAVDDDCLPSRSTVVAFRVPTTAGIPNSRAMIAGCDSAPPLSVIRPARFENSTDHTGEVIGQTSTSQGWSLWNSDSFLITRAGPREVPGDAAIPVRWPGISSVWMDGARMRSTAQRKASFRVWRRPNVRPSHE